MLALALYSGVNDPKCKYTLNLIFGYEFLVENKIVLNFMCCLVQIVTAITEPFVNKMRAFPDGTCHNILRSQPDIPSDANAVPCILPPFGDRNQS